MKAYPAVPAALVEGWTTRDQTHPPLEQVGFHYHDVEEWLEVLRGGMTFYTLAGQAAPLAVGGALRIPRGEVHRAEIGPDGVEYRMYLPVEYTAGFSNPLSDAELDLLRANLEFPLREENTDGGAAAFFDKYLADELWFCRADGNVAGKDAFRGGFTAKGRSSTGTIRVLNRKEKGLLLSTVVIVGGGTPAPTYFTNLRAFVKEGDAWKCRVWVNYARATAGDD